MDNFVHLHCHSHYSLLDGLSTIKQLVGKAVEYEQPALALTDHGNVFGAIHFYKECVKQNIKPIMGIEAYMHESVVDSKANKDRKAYHLVLLAMNNDGWRNIIRLVSASNLPDYFYYKPKVDYELLRKHSDGVIALTACMGGIIPYNILENNMDEALRHAQILHDIFGDRLYFETQNNGLKGQFDINNGVRELAAKFNRPTVATVDSHYIDRSDAAAQIELSVMVVQDRQKVLDGGFGQSSEFYFKSGEDLTLPKHEKEQTLEIAERCEVTINLEKRRYPTYKPLDHEVGFSSEDLLRFKLKDGWHNRLSSEQKRDARYVERCKKELEIVIKAGFVDYFLITADFVNWAKKKNIWVGPGRGSAGGSLLVYLLNITDVDPIEHGLIFERFYNEGREQSAPDIDVDIELRYRKDVIQYIRERFGDNRVAQLATFNTMAARAVLKDVTRFNGIDFETTNAITSLIPMKNDDHTAITLKDAIEKNSTLREYSESPEFVQCFKFAEKIEGTPKSIGTHAAAVIISDKDFSEGELPLVRSPDKKGMICGWDMKAIDSLNVLKCDILGLATLEVLHKCCDLINERCGTEFDRDYLNKLPMDDMATYKLISSGNTDGLFQIESHLGKKWSRLLKPSKLSDIADMTAILRPGPLDSGMGESYRAIKAGERDPEYVSPLLEPILRDSYGSLLFQEQIINICNTLAKMDLSESDKFRKNIGKKNIELLRASKDDFVDRLINNSGLSKEEAVSIWNDIEPHAGYGFNLAHSIEYGLITYYTAYFKTHYPLEFLCTCLNCSQYSQKPLKEIRRFINDCKLMDIMVLQPDIRLKNMEFAINGNNIAFGLSHIKEVGAAVLKKLKNVDVEHGSFYKFIFENNFNKKVVTALIYSGALDCFNMPRYRMLFEYELFKNLSSKQQSTIRELFKTERRFKSVVHQARLLADDDMTEKWKERGVKPPNVRARSSIRDLISQYEGRRPFVRKEEIEKEKYYLGIAITPEDIPCGNYSCIEIKRGEVSCGTEIAIVGKLIDVKQLRTKANNDEMAFIELDDGTYSLDGVVVFPNVYEECASSLMKGNILSVVGRVDQSGSLICRSIKVYYE